MSTLLKDDLNGSLSRGVFDRIFPQVEQQAKEHRGIALDPHWSG